MRNMLITGRNVGFFSLFLHTVDNVMSAVAEGMGAWVEWGKECAPYWAGRNVWTDFFEQPLLAERPSHFDVFSCNFGGHDKGYGQQQIHYHRKYLNQEARLVSSAAIHKYGRIKQHVLDKTDAFLATVPPNYLCIHIRGTDRQFDAKIFPVQFYIDVLREYRDRHIVVCADSEEAVAAVRQNYPHVYAYNAIRRRSYTDRIPIHMRGEHDPYKIAEDVLIDMLIMARAGLLVHTGSNVSLTSWFYNPSLPDRYIELEPKK